MKNTKIFKSPKVVIPFLIFAFMLGFNLIIKADDIKVVIGKEVNLKSKILNENRTMLIYLPDNYQINNKTYPVLYLLDGGFHFHHTSGIVQFLSAQGIIPEMIVVAITNVDRNRDFSPTHEDRIPTSGGAGKFLSFLTEELIPFIDLNYRTQNFDLLVGHSFGGTFATYALLEKPDVFEAYIAISPYLHYDNQYLIKQAETKIMSDYDKNVQFFMTLGDEPAYVPSLTKLESIIETKSPKNFDFTYIQMKDEDHGSVPHLSIYNGLQAIYSDWQVPRETFIEGLASIEKHYKKISKKYGTKLEVSENTINILGYYYLNNKEFDKAIKAFKENVKRFPASANVYDSLGEAFENSKQIKKAEKNYQKAVELAENVTHPNLIIYKDNLLRIKKETEKF